MKKCFGCRQNYPLGSGRFHYFRNQNDNFETIPCTHNPITNQPYDCVNVETIKCECGGDKLNLTHSSWCQKSTT